MTTLSQFFPSGGGSSSGGGGGVPATTTVAEVLVVGGGQSGNRRCALECCPASGGTGGGVLMSSGWNFEQGCVYTVTVGAGGPGGSETHFQPGTDSSILGYNAPPMGLVGRAAQCYCAGPAAGGATVPTHTVNGNTYHYGTETLVAEFFHDPSPAVCQMGSTNAGGAGHPGCPPNLYLEATPNGPYQYTRDLLYPGGDGMFSDITGTGAYYGPGGHGWSAHQSKPSCGIMRSTGPAGSRWARRPSISCSGCTQDFATWCVAAANYGAGGSIGACNCGAAYPQSAGGSGIVFIRYPTEYSAAASVSGNTPTPAQAGYHVYRFNGDGSITF